MNGSDRSHDLEGYYDLGSYTRPVTTSSSSCQTWFDRGLTWTWAFNHEEAAACFERAISVDPSCAMAYWGLGNSVGINYNKPYEFFDEQDLKSTVSRAHRAVEQAKANAAASSPIEQALIEALRFRYPLGHPIKDCTIWNASYAEAMASVYHSFPTDLDVAALYADALMNLTPWQLWDLRTGEPAPGARALEAKDVLHKALAQSGGVSHPGLLHLCIVCIMGQQSFPETLFLYTWETLHLT